MPTLHHRRTNSGQGLVEYALILVLVAVAVIVILAALGPSIGNIYCTITTKLNSSTKCSGSGSGGGGTITVTGGFATSAAIILTLTDSNGPVTSASGSGTNTTNGTPSIQCFMMSGNQMQCQFNNTGNGNSITIHVTSGSSSGDFSGHLG